MRLCKKPKVSVVIGVFNGAIYLPVTLNSILSQTLKDIEVVLVDDGSDAETAAVIEQLSKCDSRIKVLTKKSNEGLTKALIDGCAMAQGLYIARLDNGDIMIPDTRLEQQAGRLDRDPTLMLTGGNMLLLDMTNRRIFKTRQDFLSKERLYARVIKNQPTISHVTIMMRRDAYGKCGGYNVVCKTGQDTDLWPRLLAYGDGEVLPVFFAVATMRNDSISVANNNAQYRRRFLFHAQQIFRGGGEWNSLICATSTLVKLCIPLRLRLVLMRRKNYSYVGKYYGNNDLQSIWSWYEECSELLGCVSDEET